MKKSRIQHRASKGFTLIELLAVIAIVAILTSILIPVVSKMRTSALRSETASNLRQVFSACQLYSNENQMFLANAFIAANEETGREQGGWWHQLIAGQYLTGHGDSPADYKVLGSPIQRREVPEKTIDRDPPVYVTFGMNIVLSMIRENETTSLRANQLLEPSRTLFISEGYLRPGNDWFAIGVNPYGASPNHTAGIVTFAYADGHIGQMPDEEFPRTMGEKYSSSWYFWRGFE